MTFDSSNDTVAILYDIENAPFEMLDYTLGKARRFQPCRIIVVTDWEKCPTDQKRWERLRRRPGFTFRSVTRTYLGKNSLDSALYDSAVLLYKDGVRRFFIITTDSDFVRIAEALNKGEKSYIIGVGTRQASETLRNAYDEFLCYPPEKPVKPVKKTARKAKNEKAEKEEIAAKAEHQTQEEKPQEKAKRSSRKAAAEKAEAKETKKSAKVEKAPAEEKKPRVSKKATQDEKGREKPKTKGKEAAAKKAHGLQEQKTAEQATAPAAAEPGTLVLRLPRTLQHELVQRMQSEGVSMDELVTYLLMRGMMH
ncbi:NYN domain-containing protein [uncultured Selenomonas sp.]|uniref:NYN domain-containing protein n=1 Tax=uncultured Selenomonas sp. TaxID=159275 RepID=UPI00258E75CA|nr:NYN domain-containing protein [uncultured Selenomonas sp.]